MSKMGKIVAVCISDKKGTVKVNIKQGYFKKNFGLLHDAHAEAQTHRQISLLAHESINKMKGLGLDLKPGDFAENLTTEGLDLPSLPIGSLLAIGEDVVLEITQIGKECHAGCAILKKTGKCIMPKEGVFARVLKGGVIGLGDNAEISRG